MIDILTRIFVGALVIAVPILIAVFVPSIGTLLLGLFFLGGCLLGAYTIGMLVLEEIVPLIKEIYKKKLT